MIETLLVIGGFVLGAAVTLYAIIGICIACLWVILHDE